MECEKNLSNSILCVSTYGGGNLILGGFLSRMEDLIYTFFKDTKSWCNNSGLPLAPSSDSLRIQP